MNTKHKVAIGVAVITGISGIIGAYIQGKASGVEEQNEYIESQIANVTGDNNSVTINNVDDLIKQYNQLKEANEKLDEQNTQYFNDYTELKEENANIVSRLEGQPDYSFSSIGLSIDGENIAVDTTNSVLEFNGKEYWSKELASKLVSNDKSIVRKDNCIYVGNIVSDATNLFDLHINDSSSAVMKDMGNDSYGNSHSNVLMSYNTNSGYATFVLNRKYKYIKLSIAASSSCIENANMGYIIKADDNVVYTSKTFTKKDEPFTESSIDISNCTLLTIEFSTDNWGEAFIYDAVVFN